MSISFHNHAPGHRQGCCSAVRRAWRLPFTLRSAECYLIGVAAVGIAWVAYNFITVVLRDVAGTEGTAVALAYFVWGKWLLYNLAYNYAMAVKKRPVSTLDIDAEVLKAAMTFEWSWCVRCNRPKPPLSHHCRVCNRCWLHHDHHCIWLASCVGHGNYRHFFLFLLYLCIGSGYTCSMTLQRFSSRFASPGSARQHRATLLQCVLSGCVCAVLLPLLAWHVAVVCTGMGTLQLWRHWFAVPAAKDHHGMEQDGDAALSHKPRIMAKYPPGVGVLENWRRAFNVHGRMWWVMWLLPSSRPPHGNGYALGGASKGIELDSSHSML